MKVENAALGTAHVSPRATDAHGHQMCRHPEDDQAGDILADKKVKYVHIYMYKT